MNMNRQASVRQNSTPSGGVANPSGQANSVTDVKMNMLDEIQYIERFKKATEFNTVSQAPQAINLGQETNFKINNIGFLETIWLEINATITLKNNNAATRTINVAEDFPYSIISRIVSQFNGNTTTHNTTPYNLFMLGLKRANGVKAQNAVSASTQVADTATLTSANCNLKSCQKYPTEIMSVTVSDDTASVAVYTVEDSSNHFKTLTGLTSMAIPTGKTVTITTKFYIPVHYTARKDYPLGLIPLQNNSVYLELKAICSNILSTTYSTPFISASGAEQADITVGTNITATPHNDFYSVPDPAMGGVGLYEYFLMYNYIVNDQTVSVTTTGMDALSYIIPNNSYLASTLLTCRLASTKRLLDVNALLSNVYVDYNGTAVVRKNPLGFDLFKQALQTSGGNPCNFGQFIKDFWGNELENNGGDWSTMLNLYDANSPVLKGQVNTANVEILITKENIVPVNVNVMG